MSRQTIYGCIADREGFAWSETLVQGATRPELQRSFWMTPSDHIRTVQDAKIPIDVEHSGVPIGELVFLERRRDGSIMAVGEIEGFSPITPVKVGDEWRAVETEFYWSMTRIGHQDEGGFALVAASLTTNPARLNARRSGPVRFLEGGVDYVGVESERWQLPRDSYEYGLLRRAAETHCSRRRGGFVTPLLVAGAEHAQRPALETRRSNPVEFRSATALDLHRSRRELDVLIAPAEAPAMIHERGRSYVEVMSHGCFADAERDPGRVRVNLHHQREKLVGKCINIDAWNETGCVGTLRISNTPAGDEALSLAEDDCLSVSAGFSISPGGEQWNADRTQRRVKQASLRHVALVDEPAYEQAQILAVRSHAV